MVWLPKKTRLMRKCSARAASHRHHCTFTPTSKKNHTIPAIRYLSQLSPQQTFMGEIKLGSQMFNKCRRTNIIKERNRNAQRRHKKKTNTSPA